jgi:hypothetical protein
MNEEATGTCTAFEGTRMIATGDLAHVAAETKRVLDRGGMAPVLVFDDETAEPVEIDFRGTVDDVLARLPRPVAGETESRGPGRPKLGVVAREVTLLPRHWDWLNSQPGGASVALRKLVEQARKESEGADRIRRAQEAAYRFTSAVCGNLPGYEEALRALYNTDRARFEQQTDAWPADVRDYARKLAAEAFLER